MDTLYNSQGQELNLAGGGTAQAINYDTIVKGICHRGYNTQAGAASSAKENTEAAFRLAAENGFKYVETDVHFTSDDIAVCHHDATVSSINIRTITFNQLKTYDADILTLDSFLQLCRELGLHPYIELKRNVDYPYTQSLYESVVDMVESNGMRGHVTYISSIIPNSHEPLPFIKVKDPNARLGLWWYTTNAIGSSAITYADGLRTGTNEVFFDISTSAVDSSISVCKNAHFPLEVWVIDNSNVIIELDPYITGVTSNKLIAGKVLYEANVNV